MRNILFGFMMLCGFACLALSQTSPPPTSPGPQGTPASSIPGCSGSLTPAQEDSCTVSAEMLDAYNALQGRGDLKVGINNAGCTALYRQQMRYLSDEWHTDLVALQKAGDKNAFQDASNKHKVQFRNALDKFTSCYLSPKPKVAVGQPMS